MAETINSIIKTLAGLGGLILFGIILLSLPNDTMGITHLIGGFLIILPILALGIWALGKITKK